MHGIAVYPFLGLFLFVGLMAAGGMAVCEKNACVCLVRLSKFSQHGLGMFREMVGEITSCFACVVNLSFSDPQRQATL